MQIAFWCRLLHIPIPFRRPNMILNHVLLFLGRLSFISAAHYSPLSFSGISQSSAGKPTSSWRPGAE
jgi:hypothetical protein